MGFLWIQAVFKRFLRLDTAPVAGKNGSCANLVKEVTGGFEPPYRVLQTLA